MISFQNEIKASSQIREVEKRPRPRADLYNATQSDHHEMVTNKQTNTVCNFNHWPLEMRQQNFNLEGTEQNTQNP